MKPWYKSKTVWLAVATIVLGALEASKTVDLPEPWAGYVLIAVGVLNKALRWLTVSGVTK